MEMVKKHSHFSLGRQLLDSLRPHPELEEARRRQQEVSEAKKVLEDDGDPSWGGLRDLRPQLKRARQGSILDPDELLDVSSTLDATEELASYFLGLEEVEERFPLLWELFSALNPPAFLSQKIKGVIDPRGEVRDHASSELRSIRQGIRAAERGIREGLERIINSSSYAPYLQEKLITVRRDRYVLPVKEQHRKQVPGLIHDRSASGQTLFVEPATVVEKNNRLKQLKLEEEEEIERLLGELTLLVSQNWEQIRDDLKCLALLDFIFAKARCSQEMDGIEPFFNTEDKIEIKEGRHPLLQQDEVVPIDIELGDGFKSLVMTGPNTGGKTVSLKTVGLFALMAQSGLHLPAAKGTTLPFFRHIFADIGDEQSIEQSLSTFSSHLRQIIKITERASPPALVLLDELGAGTDPREGAALAMSLLDFFLGRGIHTISTTHYSELKTYAYSTEGVENAAVEFDVESLSPTYRVVMGLPGRSNAFEIARRLGLSEEIIHRSRQRLSHDDLRVEDMIQGVRNQKQELEDERHQAHIRQVEVEQLKEDYHRQLEELEKKKERILQEAYQEARYLLRKTKKEIKELLSRVKEERGREGDRLEGEINRRLKAREKEIEAVASSLNREKEQKGEDISELQEGQYVYIDSLQSKGQVIQVLDDGREALVQSGQIRVQAARGDLSPAPEEESQQQDHSSPQAVRSGKAASISSRLDLRGLRADEALSRTDKYLDDAYLAGLKKIEIIHGKGSGALREAVQELLEDHYHISSFRLGRSGEGGSGVTLATLKE